MSIWKTARRSLSLDNTLVMGILNVTPDSFSDGGQAFSLDDALHRADEMVAQGAHIIDVGGESTRPGSSQMSPEDEIARVVSVIDAITKRFDIPVSVDTTKSAVADAAVDVGAEIINDVSGLQFDPRIADVAARRWAGLVLMHLRGTFETMHKQTPVADIFDEVITFFRSSIDSAAAAGVPPDAIVLDPGIGFSKTFEQNLELLANLDRLVNEFLDHPLLIGTSRKSFIGKMLGGVPVGERLSGSLATAAVAAWNGAKIVRAHDVKETVDTVRVIDAIRTERNYV
jgi:dihydropteroate synthase